MFSTEAQLMLCREREGGEGGGWGGGGGDASPPSSHRRRRRPADVRILWGRLNLTAGRRFLRRFVGLFFFFNYPFIFYFFFIFLIIQLTHSFLTAKELFPGFVYIFPCYFLIFVDLNMMNMIWGQ